MGKYRLSFNMFCRITEEAVASLPEVFHDYLENTVVDVEEEPAPRDLERLEDAGTIGHGRETGRPELLGLFEGIPLTQQGYRDHYPNRVRLFKGPIERVSRSRREIIRQIRATVIHELAHHFGFSEEDLEEFERSQAEIQD